jgi:hypothetical protein
MVKPYLKTHKLNTVSAIEKTTMYFSYIYLARNNLEKMK